MYVVDDGDARACLAAAGAELGAETLMSVIEPDPIGRRGVPATTSPA
ncbi:hypothetical protein [Streptomyces sp. NPDC058457]